MDIAALGRRGLAVAPWRAGDVAETGGQGGEDRIETGDGFRRAADHHAVAAIQAPDPARSAAIDIGHALVGQCLGPANVVLVEAVAAVDDGVAGREQVAQLLNGVLSGLTGGQHQPDRAGLLQLLDQIR